LPSRAAKIAGVVGDRNYYPGMKTFRCLGWLFACALGACASNSVGPATDAPPRLAVAADEPPGIAGIYSPCGFTMVGNAGDLHFRMQLAGDKVGLRHGGSNDVFVVDGLMVQVTTVRADDISPTARGLDGVELLRLHARWESARLSETLGREVQPEDIEILAADNMPSALIWWFPGSRAEGSATTAPSGDAAAGVAATSDDRPAQENRPTGQVFMTAAYHPRVLVLSVQGLRDEPKAAMVAKAKSWMATLARSPRAMSAKQVGEEIKTAMAAGKTCPGRANAVLEQYPTATATSSKATSSP